MPDINRVKIRIIRRMKKPGFTLEGIRRGYSWEWDGTFHDSAMFGLLRDEFEHHNDT